MYKYIIIIKFFLISWASQLNAQNFRYRSIGSFKEGIATVENNSNKCGCINKKGEIIVPFVFESGSHSCIGHFNNGVASFLKYSINGLRKGFINNTGQIVVPAIYDYEGTGDFSEGLARVCKDGKIGYIDSKGNLVCPLLYDKPLFYVDEKSDFHEGLACVCKNDTCGFINTQGKLVLPMKYFYPTQFSEGLSWVSIDDQYGAINKSGKVVLPFVYEDARPFKEGLASVKVDGKWKIINKLGKVVISLDGIQSAREFSEGFSIIYRQEDDAVAVMDKTGKVVCPFLSGFDVLGEFHNGLALIQDKKTKKYGYLNNKGVISISCQFNHGSDFSEGLAAVQIDKGRLEWLIIDTKGNCVLNCL